MRSDDKVIRRAVLRLVGFPDNIGGRRKNAEIKDLLYVSGNQIFVLFLVKHFGVGTSIAIT